MELAKRKSIPHLLINLIAPQKCTICICFSKMLTLYLAKLCISMVSIPQFTAVAHQNLQLSQEVWIILVKSNSVQQKVTNFRESDKVNEILFNFENHDYVTLFLVERFSSSSHNSQQFLSAIILMRYLNPENNLRLHMYFSEQEEFNLKSWLTGAPTPQLNIIYLHEGLLETCRQSFNVLMEIDVATYILGIRGWLHKFLENMYDNVFPNLLFYFTLF